MKTTLASLGFLIAPCIAMATPSTTYWAPSTASCQAWKTPHITYDNYFGADGAYPNDLGLEAGFLPWEKLQGEAGFDVLLPGKFPAYFNAKLCTPEGSIVNGSPGLSFGVYNLGTKKNVTNYNVIHFMAQKSLPWGGYVAVGVYHGFNRVLFTNSLGNVVQTGAMAALTSPDLEIGLTGLKKVNFAGDIQTGKNVLGAWGIGSYIYFTDNISLLTGPVFFFDRKLQPGQQNFMWTAQLDVDVPLAKAEPQKTASQ